MSFCRAGHDLSGHNASWQAAGNGHVYLTCRICNSKRARAWRIANAHRLRRKRVKGKRQAGQILNRKIPK